LSVIGLGIKKYNNSNK